MKKETIKSAINVAAVILVPLINERHRIKEHPEVQRATDLSVKAYDQTKHVALKTKDKAVHTTQSAISTAHTIKQTTVGTAQFVSQSVKSTQKKRNYEQQMKRHIKQDKRAQKQAKYLQKEIDQLNTLLTKQIEQRESEEVTARQAQQKAMIKEMKRYKNYKFKQKQTKRSILPFSKNNKVTQDDEVQQVTMKTPSLKYEEHFDNAKTFEQHRQMMAEHIANR
ncbi:hypothetical protein ROU88_07445 [Macrococcus capreoli]